MRTRHCEEPSHTVLLWFGLDAQIYGKSCFSPQDGVCLVCLLCVFRPLSSVRTVADAKHPGHKYTSTHQPHTQCIGSAGSMQRKFLCDTHLSIKMIIVCEGLIVFIGFCNCNDTKRNEGGRKGGKIATARMGIDHPVKGQQLLLFQPGEICRVRSRPPGSGLTDSLLILLSLLTVFPRSPVLPPHSRCYDGRHDDDLGFCLQQQGHQQSKMLKAKRLVAI